ncbi:MULTISPECIES: ATP-binding cassette domain-containing protein [Dehalobacter]|uniref:ATP-binding cassette domain-containing protein n=2 Tax=Dehalobacter restrictus TaxID=55583 RepID=A0A857DKX5_9FIRM|nr:MULTISPECIES: ATP-binding cassette domain-containing protein [Dehalobacter]AHF10963.1 molybdate ABC transporter ATP-binding protein [Dehalobacter restrictus DSM 9455]MCG1024781.1 ATP-binding cassette domain-containing protein [Dehalobacter sp.]MDJ0307090.1 ATP-binding cassette domain-containing protein [Dehalobacter sp.]OCZ49629.1 ABC transporter [Dehalobacter sp. TeCB1]QHA01607.1 ATP-binding cassette domain-containing protein [Dehalobacter restrictus]
MLKAKFNLTLRHFELEAELEAENEILVLVGPSGSGKTTILKCLAGLKAPSQGIIQINDRIVYFSENKINCPSKERRVGYVFQEYALFPHMSVRRNILYGVSKEKRHAKPRAAEEMMEMLGILHLQNRYPQHISGGEKQRVALARALMTEPEIMLLDEPLSALDQETRSGLQQELKKIQSQWKIPFVLVTHDLAEAELLGDQIIRIDRGQSISNRRQSFGDIKG